MTARTAIDWLLLVRSIVLSWTASVSVLRDVILLQTTGSPLIVGRTMMVAITGRHADEMDGAASQAWVEVDRRRDSTRGDWFGATR